ncbi:MAG TPA: NrsF family protein [Vicinamibacterales bacterium]|nr:NrsF family protein [Vicinamibacterales bacterium]
MPDDLRERLAADFRPVRALRSPWIRALTVLPIAAMTVAAAPVFFNVRSDYARLGWSGVWGVSLLQCIVGLVVVAAALRESVPGRGWSGAAIAAWMAAPIITVLAVTFLSWDLSQVLLRRELWRIGGLCFSGSAATALPVVALASVLAARAYPTRPAIAGALIGVGAGLFADAGWRTFCHFTEPAHVLSAHLAAVVMSGLIGSLVAVRLCGVRPGTHA